MNNINTITHAIIGFAISEAFMLSPLAVVIGAVIPDIDFIIGIEHRTITHSLLFLIITSLLLLRLAGKRISYSYMLGLSSHLILDIITPMGVPLLYPLNQYYSFNLASYNDLPVNLGLIIGSIIIILNKDSIHDYFTSLKKGRLLWSVNLFLIIILITSLLFPVTGCPADPDSISTILLFPGESKVLINGFICSEIELINSTSNNEYQVFTICDETGNITVWKGSWVLENNLSKGDVIQLCGKYTRKFSEPEIYYVTSVKK